MPVAGESGELARPSTCSGSSRAASFPSRQARTRVWRATSTSTRAGCWTCCAAARPFSRDPPPRTSRPANSGRSHPRTNPTGPRCPGRRPPGSRQRPASTRWRRRRAGHRRASRACHRPPPGARVTPRRRDTPAPLIRVRHTPCSRPPDSRTRLSRIRRRRTRRGCHRRACHRRRCRPSRCRLKHRPLDRPGP